MGRRIQRLWDDLRTGYWFVPLLFVSVAMLVAVGLISLDRYLQGSGLRAWTYAGGPQNASDTLTTIASSMITFTGLVFSITIVALQLTSSQFSPRALRNFLQDRVSQSALGTFVATFAYAFTALAAVRVAAGDDASFVPAITVTGAFVLVGASLVMFVHFIHHTANSMRAVTIIERIAVGTRSTIENVYPDQPPVDATTVLPTRTYGSLHLVSASTPGSITDIDIDGLAARAARHDALAEVLHPVGTFVCRGAPLMRVRMSADGDSPDAGVDEGGFDEGGWRECVRLDTERTMRHDVAFGFRQLVDIAERALSPGLNDPSTAVQCIDRIHDLLRTMTVRNMPEVWVGTHDHVIRAWAPALTYADLVHLALDEIRHWGAGSLQVHQRLHTMLEDLLAVADHPGRRATLVEQRELLEARIVDLPSVERALVARSSATTTSPPEPGSPLTSA